MAANNDAINRYPFLHAHIAKEPHVFEVLDEISRLQHEVLRSGAGKLATLETLKESRSIKMPISPVRGKNIAYILDILANNYADEIKKIFSFRFIVEPETKKLTVAEEIELTVLMPLSEYKKIQDQRDGASLDSLHELLTRFRLFNLTKLVNKAKNRAHLARIIKADLGKNIFTFKNFSLDRNNLESSEDYCFHKNNYDAVKKTIQSDAVRKILSTYSSPVSRRLQKFGILNSEFSDYHDTKIDYLMNILLEDMPTSLAPDDLAEVKNFNSLRSCLLKVEKILDPLVTASNDLAKHIQDSGITTTEDILAEYTAITDEMLSNWIRESSVKYKFIRHESDGTVYLIDGGSFLKKITDHHTKILYHQDEFAKLSNAERQSLLDTFDLLCDAGKGLLNSADTMEHILTSEESTARLKKIIKEYEDYKKRLSLQESAEKEQTPQKEASSFIDMIAGFFKSLFGGTPDKGKKKASPGSGAGSATTAVRQSLTKDSKEILQKVKETRSKIVPLSSFLDLNDENSYQIDSIIDELRKKNLKTVIPIYNARKNLYPQRSKKYLISDVEYLMIDPDIIQSPDYIRSFTDSIAGEKIKEETIPAAAVLAIERYLLTLYRQKKAQMKRKEQKKDVEAES